MASFHVRAIPGDLDVDENDNGKVTASGLIVPYGVEAWIIEQRGAEFVRYPEVFVKGALARASRVPHRVALTYDHDDGLDNRLGFGTEFVERDDGCHGRFRLDRSRVDIARDLLTTSHRGFSIGFATLIPKPLTEQSGVLCVRRSVHLGHVAAVPEPAYATAGVLSVRAASDDDEPTEAEREYAEQQERQARALAEARELVAQGARWARGNPDGTVDVSDDEP